MDILVAAGFMLCMLYLFYEREGRQKARAQVARASKSTGLRGKRSTKRRTRKDFILAQ